jgi:hypothetical protein
MLFFVVMLNVGVGYVTGFIMFGPQGGSRTWADLPAILTMLFALILLGTYISGKIKLSMISERRPPALELAIGIIIVVLIVLFSPLYSAEKAVALTLTLNYIMIVHGVWTFIRSRKEII